MEGFLICFAAGGGGEKQLVVAAPHYSADRTLWVSHRSRTGDVERWPSVQEYVDTFYIKHRPH